MASSNGLKLVKTQTIYISIGTKIFCCTEIVEELLNTSEEIIDLTEEEPTSLIQFEPTTPNYEVTFDHSSSYSLPEESPTSPRYEPMSPVFSPPSSPSSTL